MSTVGIIAEFNPFHNGHRYLLQKAREMTGADYAIVIMSGDFVQRGAPAICDKYLRTRFALQNGADIVLELPVRYATGSAESFAFGAVKLLAATNSVDYLVFGSECGDIEILRNAARLLTSLEKSEEYHTLLSANVRSGMSFPSARAEALKRFSASENAAIPDNIPCNPEELSVLLSQPNNILAIEYLKALLKLQEEGNSRLPVPLTLQREGQAYNDNDILSTTVYPSASALRRMLLSGDGVPGGLGTFVPEAEAEMLTDSFGHFFPLTEDDFSDLFYMRLNSISDSELNSISEINPDLLNSILKYRSVPLKISELIAKVKNKAFTYTAVSRAVFRLLLQPAQSAFSSQTPLKQTTVSGEDIRPASGEIKKPYLRLLGFNRASSNILRHIQDEGACSLITKPADADRSDTGLQQDFNASALYSQVLYSKFGYLRTEELRQQPVIL